MAPGELFRSEVLAARTDGWLGSIRLQPPLLGWLFLAGSLVVMAALLGLLVEGYYTPHEQTEGTLVPNSGLITLKPTSSGTLTRLLVHEGQKIRAGEPLMEIADERQSLALGDAHKAKMVQLELKRSRLRSDLEAQEAIANVERRDLSLRRSLLQNQATEISAQIALQRQRADSAATLYRQWSRLGTSGVVSKLQLLQQHDVAIQDQVQLEELREHRLKSLQEAQQTAAELEKVPLDLVSNKNRTEREIADITQALAENAADSRSMLRAPVDGMVANLLVDQGQAVLAQQSLMSIVPSKSKLIAELWLPSSAVGIVAPGNRVTVRYKAFPFEKYGQHSGRVIEVARGATPARDVDILLGREVREPRYRVKVALDSQYVVANGIPKPLRPGMALTASVVFGRRRLIDWIMEPLAGLNLAVSDASAPKGVD